MTASNSLATPPKKKLPLLLKIYAVALIALSVISIPIAAILGFYLPSLTSDAGVPLFWACACFATAVAVRALRPKFS